MIVLLMRDFGLSSALNSLLEAMI
eukprot:COSAG04_NODE_17340_length_472_cov_0.790885_2_plen_23_part_01